MPRRRDADARMQLVDCERLPGPEPATVMRRIAAEALILQDRAESVLADIPRGAELGEVAPRSGPLIRRFFALADELPDRCDDVQQVQVRESLRTILVHHAMQLSTAMDFLAVSWRSDSLAEQVTRIGGLGRPAEVLEAIYHDLPQGS